MPQFNNSELSNEIIDATRVQSGSSRIPNTFGDVVIPVIDVNPKRNRVVTFHRIASRGTTGSTTIFTTPADKDFYLVGAFLTATQDATSDGVVMGLAVTTDGTSRSLISFRKTTLTAFQDSKQINLPIPMKVDRNTTISISQSFSVGTGTVEGIIFGFTTEVQNVR